MESKIVKLVMLTMFTLGGCASNRSEQANSQDNTTSSVVTESFDGKYITANIPSDWEIKEMVDGEEKPDTGDIKFAGLTSVEIYDNQQRKVFAIDSAYGIGDTGGCEEYHKFEDDNPAYLEEIQKQNAVFDYADMKVTDLSSDKFSEVELFGTTMRRVDNKYYWDTQEGNEYFEAACGFRAVHIQFKDMNFTVDHESVGVHEKMSGYMLNQSEEKLEEATLTQLDAVLESIEAK